MIKESYLADWRNLPEDAVKIAVTRTSGSILSPSWGLLRAYKSGEVKWEEFEKRFREEISNNPAAVELLRAIKDVSKFRYVPLITEILKTVNNHRMYP